MRLETVELYEAAHLESAAGRDMEAIDLLRSALALATLTGDQVSLSDLNAAIGAAFIREDIRKSDPSQDHLSAAIETLRTALDIGSVAGSRADAATMVNLAIAYARRYRRDGSRTDLMAAHIELDSAEQEVRKTSDPGLSTQIKAIRSSLAERGRPH